jgi:hypothetical protein
MSWDFTVEPDFQELPDWADRFVKVQAPAETTDYRGRRS